MSYVSSHSMDAMTLANRQHCPLCCNTHPEYFGFARSGVRKGHWGCKGCGAWVDDNEEWQAPRETTSKAKKRFSSLCSFFAGDRGSSEFVHEDVTWVSLVLDFMLSLLMLLFVRPHDRRR